MKLKVDSNLYLRPLSQLDLKGKYTDWFNDFLVTKYSSHGKFFKSKDYYSIYIKESNNEKNIALAIIHKKDGHIGNISLQNISQIDQNAEFAIIIGNKKYWNKKIAYKASFEIFYHGFLKLNLNKIYCGTAKSNIGMNKLAQKLGMKREGCRAKQLFLNGKFDDLIEYGILRKDFLNASNIKI
jgi:ribosomal-protein-alanine N-acetyltransferase